MAGERLAQIGSVKGADTLTHQSQSLRLFLIAAIAFQLKSSPTPFGCTIGFPVSLRMVEDLLAALNEVVVATNGETHWLWRAVDRDAFV